MTARATNHRPYEFYRRFLNLTICFSYMQFGLYINCLLVIMQTA